MFTVSDRLLADVGRAEGCRLTAYRDSLGNWTIGVGHLLEAGIDWTGHEITQETADGLLASDLADRASQAESLPEWPSLDTDCRQAALVECVFNLGLAHWRDEFPQTRAALEAQVWWQAANHLMASPKWIQQVGHNRVARIANYFANGVYPDVLVSWGADS